MKEPLVPDLVPMNDPGFYAWANEIVKEACEHAEFAGLSRLADAVILRVKSPNGAILETKIAGDTVRMFEDAILDGKPGNWKYKFWGRLVSRVRDLASKARGTAYAIGLPVKDMPDARKGIPAIARHGRRSKMARWERRGS